MSGFARWGWLGAALNAVFVLANLFCLIFLNGSILNWIAIVVCTVSGVYALKVWRRGVRDERAHHAYMAELNEHIARLRGQR